MRTHLASVAISASPEDTFGFVAELDNLPTWAIGFAKAIDHDDAGSRVTLASGDKVGIRVDADPEHGVVDYLMSPAPGVERAAHTRVLPHDGGALYTFVMHQAPGMPDQVFDKQIAELGRELGVLKAHLETDCPL